MLLAIDVGNTNIVCALYDGTTQVGFQRFTSNQIDSVDGYVTAIADAFGDDVAAMQDAVIASVVPNVTPLLCEAVERITKRAPLLVGSKSVDLGIEVRIDNPDQAGADRLVNAVGARAGHNLPAIILDFGTATTLDLVAADGGYEGGIIAPGVNLSVDALEMAAAQLPSIKVRAWDADLPILGKNTISAMESGVFWGYVGLIDGLLARLRAQYGEDLTAIATGGLAILFAEHVSGITAVDPDLTVKGLVEIYALNRSTGPI